MNDFHIAIANPEERDGIFFVPIGIELELLQESDLDEFETIVDVLLLQARKVFLAEHKLRHARLPLQ